MDALSVTAICLVAFFFTFILVSACKQSSRTNKSARHISDEWVTAPLEESRWWIDEQNRPHLCNFKQNYEDENVIGISGKCSCGAIHTDTRKKVTGFEPKSYWNGEGYAEDNKPLRIKL